MKLRVPPGYRMVTSLDDYLENPEPGLYEGSFPRLPPGDLHISVMSRQGLLPGLATRRAASLFWMSAVILYLGARYRRKGPFVRVLAAVWLVLVSSWLFTRNLWHYPADILQVPVLVIVIALIAVDTVRGLKARHIGRKG